MHQPAHRSPSYPGRNDAVVLNIVHTSTTQLFFCEMQRRAMKGYINKLASYLPALIVQHLVEEYRRHPNGVSSVPQKQRCVRVTFCMHSHVPKNKIPLRCPALTFFFPPVVVFACVL